MSDAASELEREFESRGIRRGGGLYLEADPSIELIREAAMRGVRVLGVEAFRLAHAETRPLMEHILDLSIGGRGADAACSKEDWAEAIRFIDARRAGGLHFSITLRHRAPPP